VRVSGDRHTGLTVRLGDRPEDLVETFYRLHLKTRRRQGVPIQPRRFFHLLWRHAIATGLGSVLVVEAAGTPIAAAVFLQANGTVIYKFGASDEDAWSLRPNHLLFWHAIRSACESGAKRFDWGRTDLDNEGLRSFKRSWGAEEIPLEYCSMLPRSGAAGAQHGLSGRVLGAMIRRSPETVGRLVGEALYRFVA